MSFFTREQSLQRLRAQVAAGKPIIGGGAGTGISATGALFNAAGNNTWQGPITLTSVPAINPSSVPPANVTIGVANAAESLTIDGSIGEAGGTFGLGKVGAGKLVLKQADTYNGATTVSQVDNEERAGS